MGCGASLQQQQQQDLYPNVGDDDAGDNNKIKEKMLTEKETRKVNKELMRSLGLRYASFDINALGENREHAVLDAIFSFEKQSVLYKMQIPVLDKHAHAEMENNACDHVEKEEQQQQEQILSTEHDTNCISETQEERIINQHCQNQINSMSISKSNGEIISDNVIGQGNNKERKKIDRVTDETNKLNSDRTSESASINIVTRNRWWLLNDSKYTFVLYMTILKAKNFKLLKANDRSNDSSSSNIEVEYLGNKSNNSLHDNIPKNVKTNSNNNNNNNNCSLQDKDKEADNTSSNKITVSKENNNGKLNSANPKEVSKSNDTYQNIRIVATVPPRQLLPFFEGSFDAYMWACKVRKNAKQTQLLMAKPVNHFFVDED